MRVFFFTDNNSETNIGPVNNINSETNEYIPNAYPVVITACNVDIPDGDVSGYHTEATFVDIVSGWTLPLILDTFTRRVADNADLEEKRSKLFSEIFGENHCGKSNNCIVHLNEKLKEYMKPGNLTNTREGLHRSSQVGDILHCISNLERLFIESGSIEGQEATEVFFKKCLAHVKDIKRIVMSIKTIINDDYAQWSQFLFFRENSRVYRILEEYMSNR